MQHVRRVAVLSKIFWKTVLLMNYYSMRTFIWNEVEHEFKAGPSELDFIVVNISKNAEYLKTLLFRILTTRSFSLGYFFTDVWCFSCLLSNINDCVLTFVFFHFFSSVKF